MKTKQKLELKVRKGLAGLLCKMTEIKVVGMHFLMGYSSNV